MFEWWNEVVHLVTRITSDQGHIYRYLQGDDAEHTQVWNMFAAEDLLDGQGQAFTEQELDNFAP